MTTVQKTLNLAKGRRYEDYVIEVLRPEYDYIWLWKNAPEKILITHGIIDIGNYSEYSESRKDIGMDIVAIKDNKLTFIQCKNYEDTVCVKHLAGFFYFMIVHNVSGVI